MPASENYFIGWKGRRDGPYSLEQLADLLVKGEIGLLHRVETPSGLVPLRQLLLEADPARWGDAATVQPPLGATPVIAPATGAPTAASAAPPVSAPVPASSSSANNAEPDQAIRAYTICGLCFVLPPLAFWAWKMARRLGAQGYRETEQRLKWMSLSLGVSGILLWVLVWRLW